MKNRKDGEVDIYGVVTATEARKICASLCGCDEMTAVKALSGSIPGVEKPERLHPNGHIFDRRTLVDWCTRNREKLAEATKPAIHKDAPGKLPDVKLSDDYAVSFDNAGTYQGHSAGEKP